MSDQNRWRDEERFAMDAQERERWNAWRDERDHGRYSRDAGRYNREFNGPYGNQGGGYGWRADYPQGEYSRFGYGRDYGAPSYRGQGAGYSWSGKERDWWDRTSDEVSSWFGDDDARRRREMDAQDGHRGRGPKGYARSDARIREDVCDRLSDDPVVDASEVEVTVSGSEVTLAGTVDSRAARRRAEDCAERVSGVSHVQNNLRVKATGTTTTDTTTTSARNSRNENPLPGLSAH
jgi:osmotically-inducible protein OsmY